MSVKQDRTGARTAADIERKYNFDKRFSEVMGVANDARTAAETAKDAVSKLDTDLSAEEIFNRLTNNGEEQGIYRENGDIYLNASYIKSGEFLADLIKAGVLQSKDGKTFYLDLDNGILKGQFTELSISGQTVNAIAESAADVAQGNAIATANAYTDTLDRLLDQTEVFQRLTSYGAIEGLFMEDGNLYINASYLKSGVIEGIKIIGESGSIGGFTMSENTLSTTFRRDFNFTQADLSAVEQVYRNWDNYSDTEKDLYQGKYDVNMNGRVDSGDAVVMSRMVAGTLPKYTEGKITIDATNPAEIIRIEVTGGYRDFEFVSLGLGGLVANSVEANKFGAGGKSGYSGTVTLGDKTVTITSGIITSVV